MNGETILKPHCDTIELSKNRIDRIRNIQCFEIVDSDKNQLAWGWYAEISYFASLPRSASFRGLRLRQGNIALGDEYQLADLFTERRFATWQIGEVHISPLLVPNARRDDFEHSPHYEAFLEQISLIGKKLSSMARNASKNRSICTSLDRQIEKIMKTLDQPFYWGHDEIKKVEGAARTLLQKARIEAETINATKAYEERFIIIDRELNNLGYKPILPDLIDARKVRGLNKKSLILEIAKAVSQTPNVDITNESLLDILHPYLKNFNM